MTVTGLSAVQEAIRSESMESLKIIFPIALVLISIVIFFFQRSLKGIIIVFLPLAYALILTFGVLGVVQPQLNLLAIAIVALLVGLGVDYSIHLLNRFTEESSVEDMERRVQIMLQQTGKAVLLSTVTTVIGFGSLMVSDMPPIVTFGFGCSIGIMFCFISSILMVPTLAMVLRFERREGLHTSWKDFSNFAVDNRHRVVIVATFLAIMSLVVLPNIETDVNLIDIGPEGLIEIEKYQEYSNVFGGGTNPNLMMLETNPNGLTEPELIEAMYQLQKEMERKTGANVYSVIDAVKDVTDILDRSDVINKLSDFVGGEQLILDMVAREGLVTPDYSKTIIYVAFPVGQGVSQLDPLVSKVNEIASNAQLPENGKLSQLTGSDAINVLINKQLIDQQTRSMIVALLLVLAMLIIILNSSSWGFLTMIPVAFVLMWEPGFLVVMNYPLSVVTISIASIMIGIGIDYGIHLTQRVREGIEQGLSKMEATKDAIEKTGLSLVEAAATTTAGMASVFFTNIPLIQQFGVVIIIMTLCALVATILLLPLFYNLRWVR
jgi:predicted RND superfamily exporter protein